MKKQNGLAKAVPSLLTGLLLWVGISVGHSGGPAGAEPQSPDKKSDNWNYSRHGIDLVMDGDTAAAISVFRQIQQKDPQSPLGYLLEAQAVWWRIYYSTANLLDPDVFDVARQDISPEDSHFSDLTNVAITRSDISLRAGSDVARNNLYEGMAYALQARLDGLRGKDLATARAGKKMRSYLLEALKDDPNLVDANLGLGIYNYYIDTLPPAIKLLRVLGNVPGGNRELGLQQIQKAAEKGDLVRDEAMFYLAKDYSREKEKKYKKAMEIFEQLARDHPRNSLWVLLSAEMRLRLGQNLEGDQLYRKVFQDITGKTSETDRAVHRAAREGLVRRHPTERFAD
jgi:tetratricopeptide (TPR) repeat protein